MSDTLNKCPIPGCGADPEELDGKVRCSNKKCEFSEWVTRVLWQALGSLQDIMGDFKKCPIRGCGKPARVAWREPMYNKARIKCSDKDCILGWDSNSIQEEVWEALSRD